MILDILVYLSYEANHCCCREDEYENVDGFYDALFYLGLAWFQNI